MGELGGFGDALTVEEIGGACMMKRRSLKRQPFLHPELSSHTVPPLDSNSCKKEMPSPNVCSPLLKTASVLSCINVPFPNGMLTEMGLNWNF